nr:mucin-2-like [Lytechinus pictus]
MESREKKKLAVVAGKRMSEESDSADASMEDLCRKKFKPIAPKPVIRKDQHQAVLSTAHPVKNDSTQRKEQVVFPSPKFDPSSAFIMRPGTSFPFMCGGPMIMPIPVPVVPGKDGSYVPLQVPVPIPVMVPVVVSLNQAASPSALNTVAVSSDSTHNAPCGEKESPGGSKKDKNNKKVASSKQDKTSCSGDSSDSKGAKAKPCRYKYSMIKNESLFRDILRGVGGDFMANHGISLAVSSSDGIDVNSISKGMVATLGQNKKNSESINDEAPECSQRQSKVHKDADGDDSNPSLKDINECHDGSSKSTGDVTDTVVSSKPQSSLSTTTSNQGSVVTVPGNVCVNNGPSTYPCYTNSSKETTKNSTVSASQANSNQRSLGNQLGQSVPHESNRNNFQSTSTVEMSQSVQPLGTALSNKPSSVRATTASCPLSVPESSVHTFSYYNTSCHNSVPSNLTNSNTLVSTLSSSVVPNNNLRGLRPQCPPTSSTIVSASHNPHWNYAQGNPQNMMRNEPPNRNVLRPFHNLAQRIAAVQNSEHDHPDESNFYGIDELHSFGVEMDQSAGSLLSSSDDSVSGVLGMADVAASVPGTLTDSPTRRAVTAIVTPLPRSVPLATSTTGSTSVSHMSENVPNASQSGSQSCDVPLGQMRPSSDQGNIDSNTPGSSQSNKFLQAISSSTQSTHQWSSPSNDGARRLPNAELSAMRNHYPQPTTSGSQANGIMNATSSVGQQRNMHMEGLQSRTCPTVTSSGLLSNEHVPNAQTCVENSPSTTQTPAAYSAVSQSATLNQRSQSSMSTNYSMPNMSTHQTHASRPSFDNANRNSSGNAPSYRNRNDMPNPQQMPNPLIAGNSTSGYPIQSHTKQSSYPVGVNSKEKSPSKTGGNRQADPQQSQVHNSVPSSSRMVHQSQPSILPGVATSQPGLSGFNSGNFYNASRSQAPITTRSVSDSRGMTVTSSVTGPSMSNVWQPSWSGNVPPSQSHPFTGDGSRHQQPVSAAHATCPDQTAAQARHVSTTTVTATTSVQSVPLQSNVQTRSSLIETVPPPDNQSRNHMGMSDTRGSSSNQMHLPGSVQTPLFSGNNQRQSLPHPVSSGSFNVPCTESGPRMPYPLVPPIMFGNSTPRGIPMGSPMGGIRGVPLPGSFPATSISEQNVQPPQVMSSSPSAIHHTLSPAMHERHRMYLPSHFNTLHRPLYMPPSPAPSTDLPLLSPHSCGQLHVHDSVLYSPRYPSSIHSLSPGVNTSFHASTLHRTYSSSEHQENFARNSISHPAPHYDSPMPLRMTHLGQSSMGVANAVSSQSGQVPPSITSLQHSSIVANREQNSLFEQNLKRLLERSARRHSMALASSHGYPRSLSCDHTFPPRPMSTFSSLSSFPPPHSSSSVPFSTPSTMPSTPSIQPQTRLPSQPLPSRHATTTASSGTGTATVTTVSTTLTPTTSSIVTSRAILGNTSDKYLPLELLSPDSANAQPATPATTPSVPSPQVAVDLVVKCGDTVLQCSRQVLRESGRTVLCCWHCDYHTAEPRKMKRHQKKENEPLKCQLCSYQSGSRCSVNQHYKQEHMDKDDPFRTISH